MVGDAEASKTNVAMTVTVAQTRKTDVAEKSIMIHDGNTAVIDVDGARADEVSQPPFAPFWAGPTVANRQGFVPCCKENRNKTREFPETGTELVFS